MERSEVIRWLGIIRENLIYLPQISNKQKIEALDYAISSLKTDLKYDLIYEGEEVYTKADMVAMLTDIQLEIEEKKFLESSCSFMDKAEEKNYAVYTDDISKVIQQKIDALKMN